MKVSFLAEGDKVSDKYKFAEKLITISDSKREEEKVTAETGMDLIDRINQILPDALIVGWAGPSIKFLDEKIEVYQANTGDDIDSVLKLYQSNSLKKYDMNFPDDACLGDCSKCDH